MSTPLLFSPLRLRGLESRNRVVVSPMCQYLSVDGGPTDWHLVHLGRFAIGGAGIVFCEETAVEERARKTPGCAGIYRDEHVPMYRRITDFIRANGAIPAIQLGHSGRKASCLPPWDRFAPLTGDAAWESVAPSPIPAREGYPAPHELTVAEIRQILEAWRIAAQRSLDAGFRICEVHGAHGYLIHQFLTPVANRRTDGYGGDFDGRSRFCLEVIETVRKVWPADWPLFFRVSAVDGQSGGWSLEDTVRLAALAQARGIDVVSCSSGGIGGPLTNEMVPRVAGYQVPYAERVRKDADVMTLAVGLITEPQQAEGILCAGQADLIGIAREMIYNPHWPVHAARALGVPDYLGFLPVDNAWWLRRREQIRSIPQGTSHPG